MRGHGQGVHGIASLDHQGSQPIVRREAGLLHFHRRGFHISKIVEYATTGHSIAVAKPQTIARQKRNRRLLFAEIELCHMHIAASAPSERAMIK